MKKFLSLIMVMLVALTLTGCGSEKATDKDSKKDKEVKEEKETKTDYINNNKSYFFSIDGKKIYAGAKLSTISKEGFDLKSTEEDETIPAGKYMIGAGHMVNSDNRSVFSVTPYNGKKTDVSNGDSEIGGFSISYVDAKKDENALAIEVYGGIKLNSTKAQVEKVFGKPSSTYEGTSYTTYKYESDEVYRSYTIRFDEEDKVSSIEWKNLVYNK